jgi:hypothetical protein
MMRISCIDIKTRLIVKMSIWLALEIDKYINIVIAKGIDKQDVTPFKREEDQIGKYS